VAVAPAVEPAAPTAIDGGSARHGLAPPRPPGEPRRSRGHRRGRHYGVTIAVTVAEPW